MIGKDSQLIMGTIYSATVKGVDWTRESLYLGRKQYHSQSPLRYVVVSRDKSGEVMVNTFTRFDLRRGRLIMKHMRIASLSNPEKRHLEGRLVGVGL